MGNTELKPVRERMKKYLSFLNISEGNFENICGLSKGYVSSIGDSIRVNILNKITDKYPNLNTTWLLTGEGLMLKSDKAKYNEVIPIPEGEYMMVEYADLRASAGKLGVGDVALLPDTHKRLVPKEYSNGKFLVVGVDGDSMNDGTSRSLGDGDEILICQHEGGIMDALPIKKRLFVITTLDGNVLKQITEINREEGYIVCHSFNPVYEDFKIKFDDICQIFIVYKIVQKQISLI